MAPDESESRSGSRRFRLADEPPEAAVDDGSPLVTPSFDPEALARRDTRAWQDALVIAAPPRRPSGAPGALLLVVLLALVLWLERPAPAAAAPAPSSPVPGAAGGALDERGEPTALAAIDRPRVDLARANEVISTASIEPAPGWREPFVAGAFMAVAAMIFALLRTHVPAALALAVTVPCLLHLSARPPAGATAALALATLAFAVLASRGAARPWKHLVVAGLVVTSSLTAPAVGTALLGAWALEAFVARRARATLLRAAAAAAPLLAHAAGAPVWRDPAALDAAGAAGSFASAPLLLLAVAGGAVLCVRGAWTLAAAPVALALVAAPGAGQAALVTPFAALAAAVALDAGGRALLARCGGARRWLAALGSRAASPAPAV